MSPLAHCSLREREREGGRQKRERERGDRRESTVFQLQNQQLFSAYLTDYSVSPQRVVAAGEGVEHRYSKGWGLAAQREGGTALKHSSGELFSALPCSMA